MPKKKQFTIHNSQFTIPEGIYLAITSEFCRNNDPLKTLKQALNGGIKLVQLREKNMTRKKLLFLAKKFRQLTKKHGAVLIINDFPDIALKSGADGVHLGPYDMNIKKAVKKYPGLIIGASAYNAGQALKEQRDGADYVNLGPVFATKTKVLKYKPLGIKGVKKISKKISIPFTVMGGIKEKHIKKLKQAGASRIALITEITMAENVKRSAGRLNRIFRQS